MIYIFHFFIVSILYILFARNKQTENLFIGFSFVYILFMFGQRWMTGTDFPNYLGHYLQGFVGSEWGYYGLQYFLSENNFYFGILIFTILLITQFNFYRFFLKFNRYSTLMIALFLISEMFFAQMSQIRQYVAISFFINSVFDAYLKKPVKSFLNLILAGLFHSSAFYLFPLLLFNFPFNKTIISRKRFLVILVIMSVLPFLDIHSLIALPIFGGYSGYVGSRFDVPLGSAHYIKFYIMLVVFICYAFFMEEIEKNKKNIFIMNGILLYMVIYGLSFKFALLFRVAMFFQVSEIVFLVYFSNQLKILSASINKRLIVMLFLGIFSFSALFDSYKIAEYQFRPLRLYDNRSTEELTDEIEKFYEN